MHFGLSPLDMLISLSEWLTFSASAAETERLRAWRGSVGCGVFMVMKFGCRKANVVLGRISAWSKSVISDGLGNKDAPDKQTDRYESPMFLFSFCEASAFDNRLFDETNRLTSGQ